MNGAMGQIDQVVLQKMTRIINSPASKDEKYELLDQLYLQVTNHHPDGLAAGVLKVIDEAQTEVLYPNWGKEVDRNDTLPH